MTIEQNRKWWDDYAWPQDGEEWSEAWGGAWAQWHWCIRPRIAQWLPARRLVEIAFGHGRWTHFLCHESEYMIGVDVSEQCAQYCRASFVNLRRNVTFRVCDGKTLPGISDSYADFAFSFDSLVHADAGVIAAYLKELARVLNPGATAFIHHSNIGTYPGAPNPGARSPDMTAALFAQFAQEAGVPCVLQECITWGKGPELRDCLSTIRKGPPLRAGHPTIADHGFMEDAQRIKEIAPYYATA